MKRPNYALGDVYCKHCAEVIHKHERPYKITRHLDGIRCRFCGYKVRVTTRGDRHSHNIT